MNELSCPTEEGLLPLITGEDVSAAVRSHLDDCPQCRQRVDRLRSEIDSLRQTYDHPLSTVRELATATSSQPVTPEQPAAEPLHTIGKYRVIGELAAGGQARTYRAAHPQLPMELVVKLGGQSTVDDTDQRNRLQREGRILAELSHPNLARIYDLDFDAGRPFLVMEYVRGNNLRQHAEGEKVSPGNAAALIAQVARALAAAHARGVLHLDVKPDNIVIDESGRPRLIDFGVGRIRDAWQDSRQQEQSVGGTPAFMAPEQARGEATDPRSDVFAAGAVLYYLLVGKAPFRAGSSGVSLELAQSGEFDRDALAAASVPAALRRICLRAMEPDAEDRYARADALADALERYVRRPKRAAYFFAAVAVVALAAAAVWQFWPNGQQPTDGPINTPAQNGSGVAATFEALFEIPVLRQNAAGEWDRGDLSKAHPLRTGDRLAIHGRLPPGMHAGVFWFDSEGNLHQLTHETTSSPEADWVFYPGRESFVDLSGPPGTEVLLLCARASGPIDPAEVQAAFESGQAWPSMPPGDSIIHIDREHAWIPSRGPGTAADTPEAAVLRRAEQLRARLADRFDLLMGRAITHID